MKNDGGPAFPASHTHYTPGIDVEQFSGMTLRDYFAAKAMTALVGRMVRTDTPKLLAETSYGIADAMLAEREAKP